MRTLFPITVFLVALSMAANARAAEHPLAVDFARSHIEVAVKATLDSFVGRLTAYEPTIALADDGRVTAARIAFHFRDVATGKGSRDKAMHRWQETETHPDGVFVLGSLEPEQGGSAVARGELTLHGVTRELRFPVSINRDGRWYAFDGDATVDTREFGLPGIRMLGLLKVDPLVHVRFHLQGTRGKAAASQP